MRTIVALSEFERPEGSPCWGKGIELLGTTLRGLPGWQSQGGLDPKQRTQSLPTHLKMNLAPIGGEIHRLHLVGVFALYAARDEVMPGKIGAHVDLLSNGAIVHTVSLNSSTHYVDAHAVKTVDRTSGDGVSLRTVGQLKVDGAMARVDLLSIDLPSLRDITEIHFTDSGSDASFVIFEVLAEHAAAPACPFHANSQGVSLDELASTVRVGDRVRFAHALRQLRDGIQFCEDDLDEARGLALTFLSVVCAALLEAGAERTMHRFLLEAARKFDQLQSIDQVAVEAVKLAESVTHHLMESEEAPTHTSIRRALSMIDRNFGKDLTDIVVADMVGLSTSHFRYLFRKVTGQPFHKYLMAVRLEKSKKMLVDLEMSISEVAQMAGFASAAHFSRAFAKRFNASPSQVKSASRA